MAENCKFFFFPPHSLHQFFFFTSLHQTLFFTAYGLFVFFLFNNVVKFVRNTGDIVAAFDDTAAQKPIGYKRTHYYS